MKKTVERKSRKTLRTSYKRSDFPGGLTRGKYAARLASGPSNEEIAQRIDELGRKLAMHDQAIADIIKALGELVKPPVPKKRPLS